MASYETSGRQNDPCSGGLGHELGQPAGGRQPFEHQQPAAGHRHVAQPVPRLVAPLAPLRVRHIHQQDLLESKDRVRKQDRALDLPDLKVQLRAGLGKNLRLCFQVFQFGQRAGQTNRAAGHALNPRSQATRPDDFPANTVGRGISVRLEQPISPQRRLGFVGREVPRNRGCRRHVGRHGLRLHGAELDPRGHVQEQLDPSRREPRGLGLEPFEFAANRFRLGPFAQLFGRLVPQLSLRQRLILQEHLHKPLRQFHVPIRIEGRKEFRRMDARDCGKPRVLVGEVGLQTDDHGRRQIGIQRETLLQNALATLHQGLCKCGAALIDGGNLLGQLPRQLLDRFLSPAMQQGDLPGARRGGVDPQVVQRSLETLTAVARADAPRRTATSADCARPLQAAHFVAVQIDPHPTAVEGGRAVMPAAVADQLGADRRMALHVSADIQSQRQNRAMKLKGKQDAIVAVLLAKDLAVAAEVRRPGPGAERDLPGVGRQDPRVGPQQMFARENQGVAEKAAAALDRNRMPRCGRMPAMAASVFTAIPRQLVKGPMGDQRLVDLRRPGGCVAFPLGGPSQSGSRGQEPGDERA